MRYMLRSARFRDYQRVNPDMGESATYDNINQFGDVPMG